MIRTRKTDLKARHKRIRKKLKGTGQRPRLSVFRSAKHIYAQLIDDQEGHTILSVSTLDQAFKEKMSSTGNIPSAKVVGQILAQKALDKGIKSVVYDRGGFLYHGRVKALAEEARQIGLEF